MWVLIKKDMKRHQPSHCEFDTLKKIVIFALSSVYVCAHALRLTVKRENENSANVIPISIFYLCVHTFGKAMKSHFCVVLWCDSYRMCSWYFYRREIEEKETGMSATIRKRFNGFFDVVMTK